MAALVRVEQVVKRYFAPGWPRRESFRLEADFAVEEPCTIGLLGANGSGKTTLFELLTGSNLPSEGRVLVDGKDIHKVRYRERDRLAIHYHQSYQVRRFRRTLPSALLQAAGREAPLVHLFDEPQFAIADGYIGFMLAFFARLRAQGHVVFVCVHPNEPFHLEILREACGRFMFVHQGRLVGFADYAALTADAGVRRYLGALAPA
jgi:ABC-type branched-subunit amino acid transport system ATPase component